MLTTGLALGLVTGAVAGFARSGMYATGLWQTGGSPTIPPGLFDSPASPARAASPPSARSPAVPPPAPSVALPAVLAAATASAAPPAPARLAARIDAITRSEVAGSLSASVVDVGSGKQVYARAATTPLIPASTTKVLSSATALSVLGPEHRFATSVVAGPGRQIVLVGGGDPYLARARTPGRASMADLAGATATVLKQERRTTVTVGYDASLFTGPAWSPHWPENYRDQVTPISALWVDEGRRAGSPGPRVTDPAREAALAFTAALRRAGIAVTKPVPARAPQGARVLTAVRSMPVSRIVEQVLLTSDNDAAEVLFRQAALGANRPGSFAGGRQTAREALSKLGLWGPGMAIHDGSGLARTTTVPARSLSRLLALAMQDSRPELRPLITGLPVAGVEGSLRARFFDDASLAGRGVVRAKTGSLRKVRSLAGYVRSGDGTLMAYAFLVNDARSEYAAQVWLDRVTTAVSRCGCR